MSIKHKNIVITIYDYGLNEIDTITNSNLLILCVT